MILLIKQVIFTLLQHIQYLMLRIMGLLTVKHEDVLTFIPHGGMYANGYDIFNYKSDNALSLLNYVITKYGKKYRYRLGCDKKQLATLSLRINEKYPDLDIKCFPYFGLTSFESLSLRRYSYLIRSAVVFTSEVYALPFKGPGQKGVFLGYYKPFKNDYDMHQISKKETYNRYYDVCLSSSLTSSYILSMCFDISLDKFKTLGYSRDDELLKIKPCPKLEQDIIDEMGFKPRVVFLYTPTHRDYEKMSHESRGVLGFEFDKGRMEEFLSKNNAIIICKIHNAQNSKAISEIHPKGVIFHHASNEYGLCELMQNADCLITDYTSAYFDYLLLDRPVLFNFYDYEIYETSRGFSYDPIEPILAGDIFTDEASFYEKMQKVINGIDNYKAKRKMVRDYAHKYIDVYSSERICNFVLEKD